ncbi:MAG: hypothetical protein GY716_04865 [bacterium]|nr:hypothetical protein [bacterium]
MSDSSLWKKVGLGCGAMLVLLLVAAGGLALVTLRSVRNAEIVQAEVVPELPSIARTSEDDATGSPPPDTQSGEAAGAIVLRMGTGMLFVEPAAAGEALRVVASYDEGTYEFTERLEPGDPWTYRVELQLIGSAFLTGLKEAVGGSQPHVRVLLPRDVPLRLDLWLSGGSASVDLGGIALVSADLGFDSGVLGIEASEPLARLPDKVEVYGHRGALALRSMGRVSPAELEIGFVMGEARIDLRGDWKRDATITLDSKLSDVVLRLPRVARIEGLDTTRIELPATSEIQPPTLEFSVETGMRGKIRVFE